ncbi:hypothetical protein J437_LFUL013875 [Ladona fulva]|uniref:MADF domain-containing protein n=1 Tax=Ladona fulva TaxID=123851 RepID=A0A8K0P3Y3_LADFU|nr:hypothetical protein J437_LFUL013875 [Ladona fulva]
MSTKELEKFPRGYNDYRFESNNEIFIVRWKDNKCVAVATNFDTLEPHYLRTDTAPCPNSLMQKKVIEEVRKFPVLYDKSSEKYRNFEYKDKIWKIITSNLELEGNIYNNQMINAAIQIVNAVNFTIKLSMLHVLANPYFLQGKLRSVLAQQTLPLYTFHKDGVVSVDYVVSLKVSL